MAEEISRVCDIPATSVVRYEPDGTATELANYLVGSPRGLFPVGVRMNIEGINILRLVRDSSKAARIDDYSKTHGEMADIVRRSGIKSTVGVPIVVAGGVWGTMVGSTTEPESLPEDTESRLADFTELLATAIENAESREALERLAQEQASLRRVATLVAQGARPVEVFWAVSDEVGQLFGTELAVVGRFDPDGRMLALVGAERREERWEVVDVVAPAEVFRTGRSARADAASWESAEGETAERLRSLGVVSTVASPIVVEGELWGTMVVASIFELLPPDTEERLEKFTELVATAIANAESRSELAASRRRIVAASDATRRRIERDLHDGTQQRLVSLGLAVRAAEADVPADQINLRKQLSHVATGLADAVEDLQEFSRGIHPAILSRGGLGRALATLAHRSAIAVDLDLKTDARLAEPIEVAAYFVASEALANAAKHSQASRIEVSLSQRDGSLLLSIRDNGIGGADSRQGSGLVGLRDRVEALGGAIAIDSPSGGGTSLVVTLPLEIDAAGVGSNSH
jgi:signal transduction histidine kinase